MQSLIDILSHKALVIKALVQVIYKEHSVAGYQRLVSRKTGRHRFTYEEYMILRRFGTEMIQWLHAQAESDTLPTTYPDWLNFKAIIQMAANSDDESVYFKWYDGLRQKSALDETQQQAIRQAMLDFATFLEQQLALADTEKKDYVFSTGRGGRNDKKDFN